MKKRLVDTLLLNNGLTLELFDGSRQIAADRWQVVCIAKVAVPVDGPAPEIFAAAGVDRDELRKALGDPVVFEKVLERNFVDAPDMTPVLDGLFRSLVGSMTPYLARPEFPGRFLIRKYQEHQRQAQWRRSAG